MARSLIGLFSSYRMKITLITKSILTASLLSAFSAIGAPDSSLQAFDLSQGTPPPVRFESPEHQAIGASVIIRVPEPLDDPSTVRGKPGNEVWVKSYISNNATKTLSYADIVWLSGDLMAEPNESIGLSPTPERTLGTNLAAYDKYQSYLPEILRIYSEMSEAIKEQIRTGKKLDLSTKYDLRFNDATGGWGGFVVRGLYLDLADTNFDHFDKQAEKTYFTAHEKALKTAANATSLDDLRNAYFIDGFGAHFLSDLYASGHIRVPRYEISKLCKALLPVSLKAKSMHDEDGNSGLTMVDGSGRTWFAKGDKNYYTMENTADRQRVVAALQQSVDQIYAAYLSKNPNVAANNNAMRQIMPDIEATKAKNKDEKPPLYFSNDDGRSVLKRKSSGGYAAECP